MDNSQIIHVSKPIGGFADVINRDGKAYKLVGKSNSKATGYYQLWLPKAEEVARLWDCFNKQPKPQYKEPFKGVVRLQDIDQLIYLNWSIHETCKTVARAFKGKQDGRSSTTVSSYFKLGNGKRVRISDHQAVERRSMSDFDFTFSFVRDNFYLELNGEVVLRLTNQVRPTDIQAIIDQTIIESIDCEVNFYTAKSIYETWTTQH